MWRKDPYARKQVNSSGNSVVYAPSGATAFTPPAYESQIIYQLHVGSFGASSAAVGTFSDVQSKVSYIKSLGVNMVEFLPILEFPMDDSWGYNQSDMFAPESYYGGPEALISLVNASMRRASA
jgi:1,4-alpha-glucan branching enzyme